MRNKAPKRNPNPADPLLKTPNKKKDIELTEKELGEVTGGSKDHPVYMPIVMEEVKIT
jgi:hypothetical protein